MDFHVDSQAVRSNKLLAVGSAEKEMTFVVPKEARCIVYLTFISN